MVIRSAFVNFALLTTTLVLSYGGGSHNPTYQILPATDKHFFNNTVSPHGFGFYVEENALNVAIDHVTPSLDEIIRASHLPPLSSKKFWVSSISFSHFSHGNIQLSFNHTSQSFTFEIHKLNVLLNPFKFGFDEYIECNNGFVNNATIHNFTLIFEAKIYIKDCQFKLDLDKHSIRITGDTKIIPRFEGFKCRWIFKIVNVFKKIKDIVDDEIKEIPKKFHDKIEKAINEAIKSVKTVKIPSLSERMRVCFKKGVITRNKVLHIGFDFKYEDNAQFKSVEDERKRALLMQVITTVLISIVVAVVFFYLGFKAGKMSVKKKNDRTSNEELLMADLAVTETPTV